MATIAQLKRNPQLAQTMPRKALEELLDVIDTKYYEKGTKPLPDDVYDLVMEFYEERFPKSPRLKKVGAKLSNKTAEVKLPHPMASLDKIKGQKAYDKFVSRNPGPYVISDKADGMSLEVVYKNNVPHSMFSRGSGTTGKDISHLLPYVKLPKRVPKDMIIRFEGIVSRSAFKNHLHVDAGGPFKAIRNAAGGILNTAATSKKMAQLKPIAKHMTMQGLRILAGNGSNLPLYDQYKLLSRLGFDVVVHTRLKMLPDMGFLSALLAERKKSSKFDIDGLVIEQNVPNKATARNPGYAAAFKENSEADMVLVKCIRVEWTPSRTGRWQPVIQIKPTMIGGVMVSNFTGHNAFYINHGYLKGSPDDKRKAKPRPINKGAVLKAVRSGDVIPYIVSVEKGASAPSVPKGAFKESGVFYLTTGNDATDDVKVKKLTHFLVTIGVEGFKQSTVQRFYDEGYTTLGKLLRLKVSDFDKIEGMGKRKAHLYLDSLRKALDSLDFVKIANASGYFKGFSTEKLTELYDNVPKLLQVNVATAKGRRSLETTILNLHGFSDKTTAVVLKGLPKLQNMIEKYGFDIKAPKKVKVTSNKLEGKRITFTGIRDSALGLKIREMGGIVQSFKSDTNVIITKDYGYSNNKIDKAIDAGIPVLTVEDFMKKYKVTL